MLLSESQERMLAIVERGHECEIFEVCQRWGLHTEEIGTVTDDGLISPLTTVNLRLGERLGPSTLTSASAITIPGIDMKISTMRMMISSPTSSCAATRSAATA